MTVRIEDLPADDRPRERLWAEGAQALSDRELLALLLRTGARGRSALDLGTMLLADRSGIPGIARLAPEELAALPGIGPSKAAVLVAAFEVGRRMARRDVRDPRPLKLPSEIAALVAPRLEAAARELVLVAVLDGRSCLKRLVPISAGSVDRALLSVRDVLNAVLRNDGVRFVVAHNHPSGDVSPSLEDQEVTRRLHEAADTVGLTFVDHLIVAGRAWTSMRGLSEVDPVSLRA